MVVGVLVNRKKRKSEDFMRKGIRFIHELKQRDRHWNENAAKEQLLKASLSPLLPLPLPLSLSLSLPLSHPLPLSFPSQIFEVLGPSHELTIEGRRKLTSVWFLM